MTSLYERLGGEAGLQDFVAAFYAHMHGAEEARVVSALHTRPHEDMAHRLFAFLSGFTGGPALFHEIYGAPMMRARHLPFSIGVAERDAWMSCAFAAAEEVLPNTAARAEFLGKLVLFADHMRNREESA